MIFYVRGRRGRMRGNVEDLTEAVAADGLKEQHETIAIIILIKVLE